MIKTSNKTALFKALGFSLDNGSVETWVKTYSNHSGYKLKVDVEVENIDYGKKIIVQDKTTCNFKAAENFVVLECVNRLLEKGYKPENIILEKKWPTGHGTSGKLDILVTWNNGNAYLMIECKTAGAEYDKALKRIQKDGGQLFTYFQQDKHTDILMLYASSCNSKGKLQYNNEIIKIEEDYRQTSNVNDLHDRWNKLTKNNGVFDDWVKPYDFESKALTPKSLSEISQKDSSFIFNQFLEILRHNVVSDKPNAFNKIFTLFLCKIYDEWHTKDGEELAFQWFYTGYTYEGISYPQDDNVTFQKRLTDLYKKGMKAFLDKDVTDISDAEFEKKYGKLGQEVRRQLLDELVEIRLKKNNEFAFKEVYDNESFEDNAKVVKEVVELLQGYKIRYTKKQQYLSDFFEMLLTTGLKQESGQFFTPVPIAQFIIKSLPLDKLVKKKLEKGEKGDYLPTIIDYAAGSGHFITEGMHEIQNLINCLNPDDYIADTAKKIKTWKTDHFDWAYDYVYGIEKDYRLVKVGKVGCYLHGDGLAQIIHSDGLADFDRTADYKGLLQKTDKDNPQENKQFDIVISNPPYSVSAFKNNASKYYGEEDFELYNALTDQSSEIECLFIERTKQLLKEGGLAGIILPSSILSNTGIYTKAREIIFKYFEIVGIAELGSNTFMATGTNTVTLFLRRRDNYAYINTLNDVQKSFETQKDVTIQHVKAPLQKYVEHVWDDLSLEDYWTLLAKTPNKTVLHHEIFKDYKKKIKAKDENALFKEILLREIEKAAYFVMAYEQRVVIAKTGEKKEEKEFLGYEFSNRRGSEGIHPIQRGKTIDECTKLFDPDCFDNPEKASTYIYKAFSGDFKTDIDENLKNNIFHHDLIDMMTFDREAFDKTISLAAKKKVKIESKWDQTRLENIASMLKRGKSPKYGKSNVQVIKSGQARGYKNFDFSKKHYVTKTFILDERKLEKGDILINSSGVGTAGRVTLFDLEGTYVTDSHVTILRVNKNKAKPDYVLQCLASIGFKTLESLALGQSGQIELALPTIQHMKIPLPPISVQEKIVIEIEKIEQEERNIEKQIVILKTSIEDKLNSLHNKADKTVRLGDDELFDVSIGRRVLKSQLIPNGKYPVYSANVFEAFGYVDDLHITDFDSISIIWGIDGDWMVNTIPANTSFYPTDHCGVLRVKKPNTIHERYVAYALLKEGERIGFSRSKRASTDRIKGIKISLPPYEEQKQVANEVEKLESKIADLQKKLTEIPDTKNAVLKKHL
tara:strand:- start:268 stop:4032 length:3765 start_codon:yes stop_codon:yes gene_type:complete